EAEEILAETLDVIRHPDFAPLFGPGSLAEVPLTGVLKASDGVYTLSGQVDRLLIADDAVTVIDFKTNRPPPESEDQIAPAYLRQMAAYRAVLRSIYPGRPVRAVLLWTVGPKMMLLGDEILDIHAP
ncbi:MAG: PD-(D/E)XK nuclease family protein, partial [Rhodospirillales bacterium]